MDTPRRNVQNTLLAPITEPLVHSSAPISGMGGGNSSVASLRVGLDKPGPAGSVVMWANPLCSQPGPEKRREHPAARDRALGSFKGREQ